MSSWVRTGKGMPDLTVVIAGLPSSGNNLLQVTVIRCAKAAGKVIHTQIWHGNEMGTLPLPIEGVPFHIVVPIRNPVLREISAEERNFTPMYPWQVCTRGLAELVVRTKTPMMYVPYHSLVHDTEMIGQWLAKNLDLPWVPYPKGVTHDKKQRHHQGIYDADVRRRRYYERHGSGPGPDPKAEAVREEPGKG